MSTEQSFSLLQEREMDLEDLGSIRRIKLEQCVQLCQFENDANQVKKSLKYLGNLQKNCQFSKNTTKRGGGVFSCWKN